MEFGAPRQTPDPSALEREDLDSARLVAKFQAGDASVFSELYRRHYDRIYAYASAALRDVHEAEQVTQHVFLKVIEALPGYEIRADKPLRAWLFGIARNAVIDSLRRQGGLSVEEPAKLDRRREQLDAGAQFALGWVSDPELYMLIKRLPVAQLEVVVMSFILDLASSEIAVLLNRTPKAVRHLKARALATLRERLTALGREPSVARRRTPTLGRLRPVPVMAARRWALAGPARSAAAFSARARAGS